MKHYLPSIACVTALSFAPLALPATAFGQDAAKPAPGDLPAGHSMHGDAFNDGPRQKAYLMGGTGKINFPVTTKSPDAQAFFNQGVGQLHGFWYFEAERSFRQVAALDPDCAMAYWGMAKANINNAKRARDFIQKAVERRDKAVRREQLYIDAYAEYHKDDKKNDQEKRRELTRRLEDIIHEFPDDIEASALLALHIWDNSSHGIALESRTVLESLLGDVLRVEPMHPVHHYMIHLWDGDRSQNAVPSAARCGQSAPTIAHMWHMSGHTFTRLQRYADAAWQQEASARADHAHMMRDRVLPDQIHNYSHNNQWLVENLEFIGRVHDAVALAENLIELPRHPRYNGSSPEGRRRLYETLTRYELWDDLISLSGTMYLEPTELFAEQVKRLRLLGVAYFSKGDAAKGEQQTAALEAMLKQVKDDRQAAADKAEAKARQEKKPEDQVTKAMSDAIQASGDKVRSLESALADLRGYASLARGDKDKARELFDQAGDTAKERLARVWLQAGDNERAEKLIREVANVNSKQVCLLANLADILNRCGKEKEAREAFEKLREVSAYIDLDIPAMQRVAPLAQAMNLPADWRLAATVAPDVGNRPNLNDLGPFRWSPSPAADWELPGMAGRTVSLRDYRGKPVVAIFYLGAGCPHCIEQLNAFKPMQAEFAAAGISLVAVSTESVEGLKATFDKTNLAPEFPLVSDQELKVFKAYRAFDDFESKPLHGTFLIDAAGLVRWQDISFEPFTDVKFLLTESKRLLGLSPRAGGNPAVTAK